MKASILGFLSQEVTSVIAILVHQRRVKSISKMGRNLGSEIEFDAPIKNWHVLDGLGLALSLDVSGNNGHVKTLSGR